MTRVLIFPGGSEIGLEIRASLSQEKSVELYGASGDRFDSGAFLYKRYENGVPYLSNPESCLRELNRLILEWEIEFIFPAHDDACVFLSENREHLAARVLLPSRETVSVLRSKANTLAALCGIVPTPQLFTFEEAASRVKTGGAVFVKPDRGQGSQDTFTLDLTTMERTRGRETHYVFQEFLPGEEYTIDCLSDLNHRVLNARARTRKKTKNGIAVYTLPFESKEFQNIAVLISEKLRLQGAWFFQMKRDAQGALRLLEAAPRIAGSMSLYRQYGINFPLLSLFVHSGMPITIMVNEELKIKLARTLQNHYRLNLNFENVFVDLDDTLILNGQVNTKLIGLVYQWINESKKVFLITRHKGNLHETLSRMRLQGLFEGVFLLQLNQEKWEFILPNSIFIDDSFSERKKVREQLGIPTFDLSMIDCLMDART